MVSADNVNFDVLAHIFAFLGANDLVSVCLVSQSFRAGATPWLYRKVQFRLDHMKRWPLMQSAFTTILENPELGVHLRSCDIRTVPRLKDRPHPRFIATCVNSLALCPNLISFTCMTSVPPFLSILPSKTRLVDLKLLAATLNTDQSRTLSKIDGLCSVSLYEASLNICQALPRWIPTLDKTLTSLTITNSRDLNEDVLNTIVPPFSRLRGLHITGCSKISHQCVLRLIPHTPLLESMSFTTWENPVTVFSLPNKTLSLPHLRHISIDSRCCMSHEPSITAVYSNIFNPLEACPLKSITMKFSERIYIPDPFIYQLVQQYCNTLVRFNVLNAIISPESMDRLCQYCVQLEQMAVVFPTEADDMEFFMEAIRSAWVLETLIDVGDSHSVHGKRETLKRSDVRELFRSSHDLKKVISGNRCWTCERTPIYASDEENWCEDEDDEWEEKRDIDDYEIKLKLERIKHVNNVAYSLMQPC